MRFGPVEQGNRCPADGASRERLCPARIRVPERSTVGRRLPAGDPREYDTSRPPSARKGRTWMGGRAGNGRGRRHPDPKAMRNRA